MKLKKIITQYYELSYYYSLKAKLNEVKNKIRNITNFATTAALTAVENKIPSISILEKIDYNTKIREVENKIIADHDHDKILLLKKLIS